MRPSTLFACTLLFLIFMLALVGPLISGYTYYDIDLVHANMSPGTAHWFGTDDLGRDMFTRICYGARISLLIGISAACIDCMIGVVWGGVAAYSGGRMEELMMRTADMIYSLPYVLVVILLIVFMGQGILTMVIALTVTGWITMARVVRAKILQVKQLEFVLASQALGASAGRIIFKHLLPNAAGPVIATLMLTIPTAIFTEAFLSFLGLGVQAPIASWGSMANDGLPALHYYPWRLLFPIGCISLTMLAFNRIGDELLEQSER